EAVLISEAEVAATLDSLGIDGSVVRIPDDQDPGWFMADLGPEPTVPDLQVIDSWQVDPIISTSAGAYFGRTELSDGSIVYLVSDPDIFATHGLVHDNNAALALSIVAEARGRRTVVIDETIHGFVVRPSISRELMRFPLVLAVVQVLLVAMLVVWAGVQRFGRPRDPEPELPGGPVTIIDETADVLEHSGHAGSAVARYLQLAIREVGQQLHAPSLRDYQARIEWL